MTEREASRLDKFKQLLAGPNTDLGKTCSFRNSPLTCQCVLLCVISLSPLVSIWLLPLYISHLLFTWAFFILPAPSLLYFLSFWLLTLTLLALSASCAVLLTMLQGVSHPAIWTCRLREEKKCHQQQKLVRGLCSNQTTGLYCLSNPRDCLLSLPSQCPWNLVDPLLMVDFVSSNTNFWHVLPVNLEKKNEVAIEWLNEIILWILQDAATEHLSLAKRWNGTRMMFDNVRRAVNEYEEWVQGFKVQVFKVFVPGTDNIFILKLHHNL